MSWFVNKTLRFGQHLDDGMFEHMANGRKEELDGLSADFIGSLDAVGLAHVLTSRASDVARPK